MEDRRTMIRRGAVVIGCLLILLGLIIWGTLRLDTSSTNQSKVAKADKIHVAVVNDDSGSYYQRKVYQLGNDYLSQLQDTKNYDYAVVSRGVAESGLKKDQYQLVIYIPNNFSNAVMEINHPNPEKLDIQYKINASNEATKHQCEQIASSMIRDLNTRLTDIYTIGVMGNLYQAQNKVEDIYKRQGNLANRYQNDLSNPIASFSESFPDLNQQSNDLKRDNQEFQKMLSESLGDQYDDSLGQIQEMGTSVTDLIKEQSETNRNQAKIVSQLLKVNQGIFDDETSQFLDEMSQQNQTIQDGLSQQLDTDCANLKEDFLDYSQQYEDKVSTLNDQINQNKQTIEENTQALITDIHHQYQSDLLTLGDVLKKQDSELYQQLQDESEDVSSLQRLLDELPLKKIDTEHSPFSKETTEDIQKKIDSLNETLDELKKQGLSLSFSGNTDEMADFKEAQKTLDDLSKQLEDEQTKDVVISDMKQMEGTRFVVTLPENFRLDLNKTDDLKIEKMSDNQYQITVLKDLNELILPIKYHLTDMKDGKATVLVTYLQGKNSENSERQPFDVTTDLSSTSLSIADSTEMTDSTETAESSSENNSDTSETTTETTLDSSQETIESSDEIIEENPHDQQMTVHIDLTPYFDKWEDFVKVQQTISRIEGRFEERYAQADKLAKERLKQQKESVLPQVLGVDLDKPLVDLLNDIQIDEQDRQSDLQKSLNQQLDQIQQNKAQYLQALTEQTKRLSSLNKTIQQQMSQLKSLDDKMIKLEKEMPTDTDSKDHIDSLNSVSDDMTSLGKDVRQQEKQITNQMADFDQISQQFSDLSKTIKEVEKGNKGLKTQSSDLQDDFKKELEKSGDFAQSFVKVLDTAYKDGVPNEQLMKFIAQPLKGQSDEIINDKTQSYDLTTWLLLMAILSVLIAFMIQSLKYPQSYFSRLNSQRSEQAFKLVIQFIFALLLGCGIAYISKAHFPIDHSQQLWWYISLSLIALTMIFVTYLLIYYLPVVGMSLSFGVIIFELLDVMKVIQWQHLNPFGFFNQVLIEVMTNQTDLFLSLLIIVVISLMCGLIVGLIPNRK